MVIRMLVIWAVLGWAMNGCTLKATTDTSSDGTTEFVSSTSGKTWWGKDGLLKPGQHARAFISMNYDNVLQDIAKGEGEYLLGLGTVLHVPSEHQPAFAHQLQQHYVELSEIQIHKNNIQGKQFLYEVVGMITNLSLRYRIAPYSS